MTVARREDLNQNLLDQNIPELKLKFWTQMLSPQSSLDSKSINQKSGTFFEPKEL